MPVNMGELSVSGKLDLNILAEALIENTTNGYVMTLTFLCFQIHSQHLVTFVLFEILVTQHLLATLFIKRVTLHENKVSILNVCGKLSLGVGSPVI
ncbi:hypothetical protein E2986_12728 [Frieseomelitta varia]|uniref:Uncharacterized protein n=1 Tax=Frieseomelitta varia TaxID=561572 RepID=A0A833RPX8_9HYME|nr:hypothetical protein E2986_12728 [Frieseomelitta varia]